MNKLRLILLFLLMAGGVNAQLMQINNTPGGYQWKAGKDDSLHIIPRGPDTPATGNNKYGVPTVGALFMQTIGSDSAVLWQRSLTRWLKVGGIGGGSGGGGYTIGAVDSIWRVAGIDSIYWSKNNITRSLKDSTGLGASTDTTIYNTIIDSTGQPSYRVLWALNNKIWSDTGFRYNPAMSRVTLGPLVIDTTRTTTSLLVNGGTYSNVYVTTQGRVMNNYGMGLLFNDSLQLKPIVQRSDLSRFKPMMVDANGWVAKFPSWRALADSIGAAGGTVTSVDVSGGTTGLSFTGGPVTSSGTITASGTLDVANGGTANTTFTPYSPVYAGTTATGAFQSSTLGASGTVLTSTGTGSLPTWQTPASGTPIDSVAIKRFGTNLNHFRSWNTNVYGNTSNPSAITNAGQDSTSWYLGYNAGNDNTSGYHNIYWGARSGFKSTTAFSNIAIGNSTMGANSASAFTGDNNVAIGGGATNGSTYWAPLQVATTARANVAIGGSRLAATTGTAGSAITSGIENTLVGAGAGLAVTTGSRNIAIGATALQTNTTSGNNTAIGFMALSSLNSSSAGANTAVGASALSSLSSGTADAFGASSGTAFTTGARNFAMGSLSYSGASTTNTGSDNMGLGYGSGIHANSLGSIATSRNTLVGNYSGAGGINGMNDNTFIGYASGNGTTSATSISGTKNIAIGSAAALPSLSSSNQIQFWVGATGGTGGYNALTRFTGGGWLLNNTTSAVTAATTSTAFEINGTTGAILFPRLTTTQKNALTGTAGHMVYDNERASLGLYTSTWGDIYPSKYTLATDAPYGFDSATDFVTLPTITANRLLSLPAASASPARRIVIKVSNSAAFSWTTSAALKDKNDADVSTLANDTVYTIISDGTNWNIISIY